METNVKKVFLASSENFENCYIFDCFDDYEKYYLIEYIKKHC